MPRSSSRSGQSLLRIGCLLLTLCLPVLVGSKCDPGGSPLARVGVCKVDITPITPSLASTYEATFGGTAVVNHTDPVYLAGFGNDRQATGYNDRLWARGMVVASTCDLIAFSNRNSSKPTRWPGCTLRIRICPC